MGKKDFFADCQSFIKEKKWKQMKKSDWLIVALTGVLILIIAIPLDGGFGFGSGAKDNQPQSTAESESTEDADALKESSYEEDTYAAYLEKKLEKQLSLMEGVGKVTVMITLSDEGEHVVEKDVNRSDNTVTETDSSGGSRSTNETTVGETSIYVQNENETIPYVQKELTPSVEGVFVVAEGGGNPTVVANISEAIQALFTVEPHRIEVVKMGSYHE